MQSGTIPKILFFGVAALSARFSSHASLANVEPRERGRPYARETERLLNLHEISLTTVQVCILLGHISIVEGEPATESVFFSIACRMALILDLPHARAATPLQRELNLRGRGDDVLSSTNCYCLILILVIVLTLCAASLYM